MFIKICTEVLIIDLDFLKLFIRTVVGIFLFLRIRWLSEYQVDVAS